MLDDSERVVAAAPQALPADSIAAGGAPADSIAASGAPAAPAARGLLPGTLGVLRIVAGRQQPRNPLRIIRMLRILAVSEATAFLTLITVAVVHGVTGGAGWELFVMGNVHGAVFTSYLVIITVCHRIVRWGPLMLLMVLLAGFIPGGGLMVERWALAAPAREAYQARQDG